MKYRKAAVGGTFDHFHAGHQQLIKTALQAADQIAIGITNQALTTDKPLSHLIESYQQRQKNVSDFIHQEKTVIKVDLVELTDPFGPTLTDPAIDALVVSEMTAGGARLVNQERQKIKLPPLPIVITPMISDEEGGHISSTEIRNGQISRHGRVFKKLFEQDIIFTSKQLNLLKLPQGITVTQPEKIKANRIFLIGDVVTKYFIDHNLTFTFAITDGKSRKQPVDFYLPNVHKISMYNKPGTINSQLAQKLITAFSNDNPGTIYQVDGEEDLLTFIPCLTESLETVVIYGQPEGGIVMITLTETKKLQLARYINPTFR